MTICIKTGAKVWIEETGKIYSADVHSVSGIYVIYHALTPLHEHVWSFEDALEAGAEVLCGAHEDSWYRERAMVWISKSAGTRDKKESDDE